MTKYSGTELRSANGASKLIWWIMVTSVGVVLTGGGIYASVINGKFKEYDSLVTSRGERLASVETNYKAIESRLVNFEQRTEKNFDEVGGKLDFLIGRLK